jgi:hypothetical protein
MRKDKLVSTTLPAFGISTLVGDIHDFKKK